MATSTNPGIQKLMDEIDSLESGDTSLETKLDLIAQKIVQEQHRAQAKRTSSTDEQVLIDPADAFACEGCQ
jgi:hypothetical protein